MTCRDFIDFIIEYFEGDLSSRERREFAEHLAECPDCTAYLLSYEQTIRLGKAAFAHPDVSLPADVPEKLVKAILASRRQRA